MGKNKIQRNEIGAHFKLLYVDEKKYIFIMAVT
jgi:hypothetical protein